MKLFSYKGLPMVINARDEHCPPHTHVDGGTWSARFKFSFWHNNVEIWDVVLSSRRPAAALLEGLRHGLKQPVHLRRARSIWWENLQTACLDNQLWDSHKNEVVVMKRIGSTTYMIGSAWYEPDQDKTLLALMGAPEGVEIEL